MSFHRKCLYQRSHHQSYGDLKQNEENAYRKTRLSAICFEVQKVVCSLIFKFHFKSFPFPRFEKRHRNMAVHCSPCFENVGEGDVVTIGQCRPLAKTVRFNVVEHNPSVNKSLNVKKVFRVF
jgi:ribosomal protein S17